MTIAIPQPISLEHFLTLQDIEESPAWEFIDGEAVQKPMPGGKHSRLQSRLSEAINAAGTRYEALPELRCTFGGRSVVPDIAVVAAERMPIDEAGEIISTGIEFAPDWAIEILSPDQKATRVTRNLLHYLRHGCQLGWLIDPAERVVLVFRPEQLPDEMMREDILPSLPGVTLNLTVERLFSWLKAR